ncbi:MAG: Uma2 family endonuclease [Alkalispirochaeta sp.]
MKDIIRGTSPVKRSERYTYRDYRGWPADERWELIHGTPYSMSPAPRRIHQAIVIQIAGQLDSFFAGKQCRPHIAPIDLFLDRNADPVTADNSAVDDLDSIDTIVQPDAFVVCDPQKLVDEGVRGAPDFVIEVLSPGTAMKDQTEKRKLYEEHRVAEYWIINPDTLELFVYILKDDGTYGLPTVADLRDGVESIRFKGLHIAVRPEDL